MNNNEILTCLAKRINPKYNYWCEWENNNIAANLRCLICSSIVPRYNQTNHGLMHLKKSNLLSFT